MTTILGVSALYHDAAAALICDGELIAAASEERFTRLKHDASLPVRAAIACLEQAGLSAADVDHLVYYEKPLRKFERLLVSQLMGFPRTLTSFRRASLTWLTEKLWLRNKLATDLGVPASRQLFCEHHLSHAAAAFYGSPHAEAAILVVDGVGEWATTSLFRGGPDGIEPLEEIQFPHSLGLVYSAFTAWCGFRVNNGEYKVMGLAAYGEPRFEEQVRKVLKLHDDGSFEVDTRYVAYHYSATDSINAAFETLFGPRRHPSAPLDPTTDEGRRVADVAASIQKVTEDALVGLANRLHRSTGLDTLCFAGGVALNSVANTQLLLRTPFRQLHVHPAAGDSGGALGAAWWAWHDVLGKPRVKPLTTPGLGKEWPAGEIRTLLDDLHLPYRDVTDTLVESAADDLAAGKVLGWSQGRFEWGPRALGHRSILSDPRGQQTQARINDKVKFREAFRPFAPSILAGRASEFVRVPEGGDQPARWMLLVAPVAEGVAERLPATTHVDGTARVQLVDDEMNPLYAQLLRAFDARTDTPVLLNTSFNLKGEPMVAAPIDAISTFHRSGLDVLYVGPFRVEQQGLYSSKTQT